MAHLHRQKLVQLAKHRDALLEQGASADLAKSAVKAACVLGDAPLMPATAAVRSKRPKVKASKKARRR